MGAFEAMDADGNGVLSFNEFVGAMCADQEARVFLDEAFSALRDFYRAVQHNSATGEGDPTVDTLSALRAFGVVVEPSENDMRGNHYPLLRPSGDPSCGV